MFISMRKFLVLLGECKLERSSARGTFLVEEFTCIVDVLLLLLLR